ncbi:tRNA pseudouridine(38-40) synthase TruA [Oribacterium sp. Sow4_G1_1]|uniref:tRNA pseudouridine(38-40) synthase TruA n=1 Tax=Oribacterium sp. Sow4_G1_1 TaxID=3438794 RepID=UPI003F95D85D
MRRIRLTIAYDGTNYRGWQIQQPTAAHPEGSFPTIQGELQRALGQLLPKEAVYGAAPEKSLDPLTSPDHVDEATAPGILPVVGASRTDSGVHALGNVACFDTESTIPAANFPKAINRYLPPDIRVMQADEVSMDFHPRFVPHEKCYEYRIDHGRVANPLTRLYAYNYTYPLDLERMRAAARELVGVHDFTSFVNPDSQVFEHGGDAVREIYSIDILKEGTQLVIRIRGDGFLYHMIRIIVGTLLVIGNGRRAPEDIRTMLAAKDRTTAGPTVPAHGLCLCALHYDEAATADDARDDGDIKTLATQDRVSENE